MKRRIYIFVPMEERVEIGTAETFYLILFSLAIRCGDFFHKDTGFEFTLSLK